MNYENDANLDPAAWLLFEILRGACIPANAAHCCSAKERLETYQKQFQAATRVLVWLDLAVVDRENALGCRPADVLMSLVVHMPQYRLMSSGSKAAPIDRHFMETMIEAALKQDAVDKELRDCAIKALGAVGLVRYHARLKRPVPTKVLGSLIVRSTSQDRRLRHAAIKTQRLGLLDGSQIPAAPASS
jgi:hypothetical protein